MGVWSRDGQSPDCPFTQISLRSISLRIQVKQRQTCPPYRSCYLQSEKMHPIGLLSNSRTCLSSQAHDSLHIHTAAPARRFPSMKKGHTPCSFVHLRSMLTQWTPTTACTRRCAWLTAYTAKGLRLPPPPQNVCTARLSTRAQMPAPNKHFNHSNACSIASSFSSTAFTASSAS